MAFTPVVVDDTIARLKNITDARITREPHMHVVIYPGARVLTGPIRTVESADRIASNASIKHPESQVHVKTCRHGELCR